MDIVLQICHAGASCSPIALGPPFANRHVYCGGFLAPFRVASFEIVTYGGTLAS